MLGEEFERIHDCFLRARKYPQEDGYPQENEKTFFTILTAIMSLYEKHNAGGGTTTDPNEMEE